ncbi:hypothetical protein K437DRAFT_228298 [Tilletiaria anomala UBC 951]|uniref:Phosphatidylglycerol/phosphatidylinositol transfer protein n=1 Tax=Tilletiaria anomala (strain ATCC 24038 / CBS 436.72 / UBC 951) TaxID=1037660 RepID=A0A066VF72_TILAU|nr:uncharacterized protein K437DRAFT_228298 [Tilletiaria anomala UBC 951]KDN38948.1 hypothetical protein K437DRAFT_228298 [Tilletiaria anomala UBC 951]
MPWSFKLSNPSSTAETKGEPGRGWIWKSCGMDADAVRVDSIDVTPDPPKPGRNMTVRGTGVVRSLIDEGSYVDVVVKIGLIKLLSRRFDLCEEAKNANAQVQCPIKPGTYDIEQTVALPREIPPAKFNVHITGATQAEEDLMCLDLSINFMHI